MSRASVEPRRAELLTALADELGRKAAITILVFHTALAERLGLNLTDLFAGELLSRTGPLTAGELAQLTGLTTGAITGVIDRLEKSGYVRRENDPQDRRRVVLRALPDTWKKTGAPLYESLNHQFEELFKQYSDQELAVVADFLRQMSQVYDQEAAHLRANSEHRAEPDEPLVRLYADASIPAIPGFRLRADAQVRIGNKHDTENTRNFSAPLDAHTQARLQLDAGPLHINLRGERDATHLYRAQFHGDIPTVRLEDDSVSMQYRHRTLFGRGGGQADIHLNNTVLWDLDLRCGASHIQSDLRTLPLRALTLKTNASNIHIQLPLPAGTIPLRIETSSSHVTLQRPRDIPVRVQVDGDAPKFRLDNSRPINLQDDTRESPDYKRATNRYLIQIIGTTNKLEITESK